MPTAPNTSITLLKGLASGADSVRWTEFYRIYEGPMRAFLRARFPSVEADDVLQETMLALARRMPDYHYTPDRNGHFRNYLMGILKHKAMDALAVRTREARFREDLAERPAGEGAADEEEWKHAALEVAIAQLLADKDINPLHRTVFERLVLQREKPEDVARELGTSRGNVDVIKKRMIERLGAMMARLIAS